MLTLYSLYNAVFQPLVNGILPVSEGILHQSLDMASIAGHLLDYLSNSFYGMLNGTNVSYLVHCTMVFALILSLRELIYAFVVYILSLFTVWQTNQFTVKDYYDVIWSNLYVRLSFSAYCLFLLLLGGISVPLETLFMLFSISSTVVVAAESLSNYSLMSKLGNIITDALLVHCDSPYVPTHDTHVLATGRGVLQNMLTHSESNCPQLANFIKEYCNDLLHLPSHTQVLISSLDKEVLISQGKPLDSYRFSSQFNSPHEAGQYLIINKHNTDCFYVGSSISVDYRVSSHHKLVRSYPMTSFLYDGIRSEGGAANFVVATLAKFAPFDQAFFEMHPDLRKDATVDYIIDAYSKYKTRFTEQALIHHMRPSLNQLHLDVKLDFLKWGPQSASLKLGTFFEVYDTKGNLLDSHTSVRSAEQVMDASRSKLSAYLNKTRSFYSNYYKSEVFIVDPTKDVLGSNLERMVDYGPVRKIDINSLEPQSYYTFHADGTLYRKFDNYTSVMKHFTSPASHFLRRVNKECLFAVTVAATGQVLQLYFCRNPASVGAHGMTRPVYLVNSKTGEQTLFPSGKLAAASVGVPDRNAIQRMKGKVWLSDEYHIIRANK